MHNLSLVSATAGDADFALHVTEVCMRAYAERAFGRWDGERARADFDPAFDKIVVLGGDGIGLIGIDSRADYWFLDKLYLLPAYQNRGIGSHLLRDAIAEAKAAKIPFRLTVLEINPARRLYERHGFVLTHTVPPRHHMEWRGT